MSIHDLLQPNMYDIQVDTLKIGKAQTNSFRKFKTNVQSITPIDPTPAIISFDSFANQFTYLDNVPDNCFTFIDSNNIQVNKSGIYQLFCQVDAGNEIPGSYVIIGFNLQGTILTMSESIGINVNSMVPFNNGFHSQNTIIQVSTMTHLNAADIIQVQYLCSANTDIYPTSYVTMKYISI